MELSPLESVFPELWLHDIRPYLDMQDVLTLSHTSSVLASAMAPFFDQWIRRVLAIFHGYTDANTIPRGYRRKPSETGSSPELISLKKRLALCERLAREESPCSAVHIIILIGVIPMVDAFQRFKGCEPSSDQVLVSHFEEGTLMSDHPSMVVSSDDYHIFSSFYEKYRPPLLSDALHRFLVSLSNPRPVDYVLAFFYRLVLEYPHAMFFDTYSGVDHGLLFAEVESLPRIDIVGIDPTEHYSQSPFIPLRVVD
jgi:hypothetical protein